jgi:hypothetical protein
MTKWQGELDYVDDQNYRKASFDAWLSWEFLQRTFAGCSDEVTPSEIGELCGKTTLATRHMTHRALKRARYNA